MTYILMDFCHGGDLDCLVRDQGAQTERRSLHLVGGLLAALVHVHESGIVHRDVKPANVMLQDGDAILVDFGIAVLASNRVAMKQVRGTCGFMAPEVIRAGSNNSSKVDVFSAGATFYYVLTGNLLFNANSTAGLLEANFDCCVRVPTGLRLQSCTVNALLLMLARRHIMRPTSSKALAVVREAACGNVDITTTENPA